MSLARKLKVPSKQIRVQEFRSHLKEKLQGIRRRPALLDMVKHRKLLGVIFLGRKVSHTTMFIISREMEKNSTSDPDVMQINVHIRMHFMADNPAALIPAAKAFNKQTESLVSLSAKAVQQGGRTILTKSFIVQKKASVNAC